MDYKAIDACRKKRKAKQAFYSKELENFHSVPPIARSGNSLHWGKANIEHLICLESMVLKYLCPLPSTVAYERLFSSERRIYSCCLFQ